MYVSIILLALLCDLLNLLQTMIRIWDTFLYEGSKVLFRYAVAIFLYNQDALLSESNTIAIFNRLRSMCKEATDVKRLTEVC